VLGFINADDYFLPGALSTAAAYFRDSGRDRFVSGSGYIEMQDGTRIKVFPTPITKIRYLYGACNVFQQATFFPKNRFDEVGGFNPHNRTCWDGELFLDLVCMGLPHNVIYTDMAVFRIYGESITGSGRLNDPIAGDLRRMFRDKLGREPNAFDPIVSLVLRALKYAATVPRRITM
jgi:hypothetical protein